MNNRKNARRIFFEEEEEIRRNKLWGELKEHQQRGKTNKSGDNATCNLERVEQQRMVQVVAHNLSTPGTNREEGQEP